MFTDTNGEWLNVITTVQVVSGSEKSS